MSEQENVLKHKGLQGSVEVSLEDSVLHGRVLCIDDLVTFEAKTPDGLRQAFEQQVDEYLAFCEEESAAPETGSVPNLTRLKARWQSEALESLSLQRPPGSMQREWLQEEAAGIRRQAEEES